MTPPVIGLDRASKTYGAVRALRGASIELRAGEVRGLVGENGAGKSTLVRLLGGVQSPDDGTVLVDGEPVELHSPHDARDAGVAVIYQEPTLFPDLSVAENVVMGRHPLRGLRRIDRRRINREVGELMRRLGVRLDPSRPVRGLSIADQQIVEIAARPAARPRARGGGLVKAALATLALALIAAAPARASVDAHIVNFDPRGGQVIKLDVDGNGVDAHDGEIARFGQRYWPYGTSYDCGYGLLVPGTRFCGFKAYSDADPYPGGGALYSSDGGQTWRAEAGRDLKFETSVR